MHVLTNSCPPRRSSDLTNRQSECTGIRVQGVDHLESKLTGGDEHASAGTLGGRAIFVARAAGQHRQAEGESLARPGLCAAEDVGSGERVRSGEPTSERPSLMRIWYAVCCLKNNT